MDTFFKILLGCSFLFLSSCTSLIYQPDKYLHGHPDQFKTKFAERVIHSQDGTKLALWKLFSKKAKPKKLLVYFHGNAQNMTAHFMNAVWMTDFDYDVMIFDYRGFGLSEGEPNPKGVAEDGVAFLNESYKDYKNGGYEQLIVYGQSLGGAVVLKSMESFSHRDEIDLLVLDSTFLSPQEVAREKTFFPLSLIITDGHTADPELKHITMPVLFMHSKKDHVIAYKLGEKLSEKINTSPKKVFWTFDDEGHGNVFFVQEKKYQKMFLDFVNELQ
jgi:alpha-beta hydrolase superfamily lysophospholipase